MHRRFTAENGWNTEKAWRLNTSRLPLRRKACPFLDLLLEEADAYIRHYEEMRGHAGLLLPVMRALTLGSAARDRLFDLLEGKEVQTEDEKGAERVCRVERKDPRFPVEVEARGDGIAVTVPSALTSFRGEQRLYVADGCICLDAVN